MNLIIYVAPRKDPNRKRLKLYLMWPRKSITLFCCLGHLLCQGDHRPYDIYHQVNILWHGLLGKDKYEFANNYCSVKPVQASQGKVFMDFSKGIRLEELNILLRQTLMIRRLKEHVMAQLPPKRRQIIRLMLNTSDIQLAIKSCKNPHNISMNRQQMDELVLNEFSYQSIHGDEKSENSNLISDEHDFKKSTKKLSYQEIGIAKLSGFREWLSNHAIIRESDDAENLDATPVSQKMIIFAHHLKVLDKIQEFVHERGIKFVRIDGGTLAKDRQSAVNDFRQLLEVKIAIVGITAGGVGLDFSSARNVVFLELPKSASEMLQAEDRAHRRGQTNAVNIYIFCAKDTSDESHWLHLNKSLFRVSSVMNGKYDAIKEIEVDHVFHLEYYNNSSNNVNPGDPHNSEDKCRSIAMKCYDVESEGFKSTVNRRGNSSIDEENASLFEADEISDLRVDETCGSCGKLKCDDSDHVQSRKGYVLSGCMLDEGDEKSKMMENAKAEDDNMYTIKDNNIDGTTCNLVQVDASSYIQADMLRFEVSQYTGRVHLYICIPGKDSRPRPLFENFRPEELESVVLCSGDINRETTLQLLKKSPACGNSFQTFMREWNDLRPIERNKLHGKPLQLPLTLELCYLKETINHGCEGLLKGGSNRRVTPLSDIGGPLPENVVWKKIALWASHGKVKEYTQAWNCSDEPLCKLCQTPLNGKLARVPDFFEDLFCNLSCFQEYRIRTSQRALREALFQVERGICTQCKLDCHKLVKCIRPLSEQKRQEHIEKVAPNLANKRRLLEKLVREPIEGNAWHADHIIPVYKGGGECRLENMRTLCVACHSEVTAAQRVERLLTRLRAKEQLKVTMKKLKNCSKAKPAKSVDAGSGQTEVSGDLEDKLFVKVPGSAYSVEDSKVSDV